MTFCQCPNCKRIKFLCNKKIIWVKLLPSEENALEEICLSDYLLTLVDGYDPQIEYCDECCLIEQN